MAKPDPPEPNFQIEDATYTYCHETDAWSFTLPFNNRLRFIKFNAYIPNNSLFAIQHISLHLGFDILTKNRDDLLRRIRKCKGRKQ